MKPGCQPRSVLFDSSIAKDPYAPPKKARRSFNLKTCTYNVLFNLGFDMLFENCDDGRRAAMLLPRRLEIQRRPLPTSIFRSSERVLHKRRSLS